jgi:hypothetical protein
LEAQQAAEKGLISGEFDEKHPSWAKARVDLIAFAARLKSCPDTKQPLETPFTISAFRPLE